VKRARTSQAEFGHPMTRLETAVQGVMELQKRHLSPLSQLAFTACFEHFTATFAHILLSRGGLRPMRAPQRRLWMWHALEEIEHKGVAFDVYIAMGGGYLRRVLAMLWVTVLFALTLGLVRIYLHWRRGVLFNMKTAWSMMHFGLIDPGYAVRFLWPWASFFDPAFHPWGNHSDDATLLATYSILLQGPQDAPYRPPVVAKKSVAL
jgi:predicted metal-dependent hydrolase